MVRPLRLPGDRAARHRRRRLPPHVLALPRGGGPRPRRRSRPRPRRAGPTSPPPSTPPASATTPTRPSGATIDAAARRGRRGREAPLDRPRLSRGRGRHDPARGEADRGGARRRAGRGQRAEPARTREPGCSGSTAGRSSKSTARGKHLLLDFGDLALHSHLGMSGSWHVYGRGAAWRKPAGAAWAVLRGRERRSGPVRRPDPEGAQQPMPCAATRPSPASAPTSSPPDFDPARVARSLRSRPAPRPRRRPARPDPGRRHRQHLQERGLLRRPPRPLAADRRPRPTSSSSASAKPPTT